VQLVPVYGAHMSHTDEHTIGKFRIERELGRGAMGIVYEAVQSDLQRRVALKVIAPNVVAAVGDAAHRGFEREAQLAASVHHPGIVVVHEVGVVDGQAYLAMEFVDGTSLAERLQDRSHVDPQEAASMVLEIARAVAALHERGIVHRDLKPDNVLVDRDGRTRVTDFGLALLRNDDDDQSSGTPGFMAPEQLSANFGAVSERSDVYALGAILHLLLTGRVPHEAANVLHTIMATIERDLPPTIQGIGLPAALAAICRRCLERKPEHRYESAAALADDLERWLRGDAPKATPPGIARRTQLFFRRRRMLSAHLCTLLVFALLGVVDHVLLQATTLQYFLSIYAVLGILTVTSLLLDWLERQRLLGRATRFVWPVFDCAGLSWVLYEGNGLQSSLVILYPLLILSAGFWLDRMVVVVATASTLTFYCLLIPSTKATPPIGADQHLAVFTTILVTGLIVSLQVARTRALHDYVARRM
jgi:eukaryotic-like serine/threonine-protein kinase